MIGGQVSSITACMFELSRMVVSPNEAKSFASTLFFMSSISLGKYSCRDLYKTLVARDCFIPAREETFFFPASTIAITFRSSGQCVWEAICTATLSLPSAFSPFFHPTTPPKTLLHAEPLPRRARIESSCAFKFNPAALEAAQAKAAKPAALDAKPAAVGKLL